MHFSYRSLLSANQELRSSICVKQREEPTNNRETIDYAVQKLSSVLNGEAVQNTDPPSIDILYCEHGISRTGHNIDSDSMRTLLISERRRLVHDYLKDNHPHLPKSSLPYIFPLYHPSSIDVLVRWEVPDQSRHGYLFSTGLFLGAEHAALEDVIQNVKEAKPKRNMFAETAREREDILDAIRASEWNMEMNPVVTFVSAAATILHDFSDG